MSRPVYLAIGLAVILFAGFWLTYDVGDDIASTPSPGGPAEGGPLIKVSVPDSFSEKASMGRRGFEAKCIACHGENAAGVEGAGPPLVHEVYEPSHHGDAAFWLATQNGVAAHHWRFGSMPPVDGLSRSEVDAIVAYVRELQRANGID